MGNTTSVKEHKIDDALIEMLQKNNQNATAIQKEMNELQVKLNLVKQSENFLIELYKRLNKIPSNAEISEKEGVYYFECFEYE